MLIKAFRKGAKPISSVESIIPTNSGYILMGVAESGEVFRRHLSLSRFEQAVLEHGLERVEKVIIREGEEVTWLGAFNPAHVTHAVDVSTAHGDECTEINVSKGHSIRLNESLENVAHRLGMKTGFSIVRGDQGRQYDIAVSYDQIAKISKIPEKDKWQHLSPTPDYKITFRNADVRGMAVDGSNWRLQQWQVGKSVRGRLSSLAGSVAQGTSRISNVLTRRTGDASQPSEQQTPHP